MRLQSPGATPLVRAALLVCAAGVLTGCAVASRGTAQPAERTATAAEYVELAGWFREATFYLDRQACEQAMGPLNRLIENDRHLEFPLSYRLLEECHTSAGEHGDARTAYTEARERALAHPDAGVRGLAEVFEEWAHRYDVYLETGQRVISQPDALPSAVNGEETLRPRLTAPDSTTEDPFRGEILVQARVDEDGEVLHAFVQTTSGMAAYDRAALAAVRGTRFVPARLGDRAIRSWISIPIVF